MPGETPVLVVDAFTNEPFRGNPAGVVLLEKPRPDDWMQSFAAEMKHAETAFLVPEEGGFHLRWFTPVAEVDLCGHATLASAHALWETGTLEAGHEARFRTRSGLLTARQSRAGIEMDFPAQPPRPVEDCDSEGGTGLVGAVVNKALSGAVCEAIFRGLGVRGRYVGWNGSDYLIELDSEEAVRALKPDFATLGSIGTRGVIATAAAGNGKGERASGSNGPAYDFISRFFAPAFGIDEDPVTGSAHCALGPYWGAKLGKDEVLGYQASPRGGTVAIKLRGDRVALVGKAVTILRGTIAV
ncbi:MAG TPA: PhzF family phenazine biosynthesis protein [Candidatus Binatia bacterium]|nr:PhzF family phenazine biosynthesis protein [Candidatus Binatia bacterium]